MDEKLAGFERSSELFMTLPPPAATAVLVNMSGLNSTVRIETSGNDKFQLADGTPTSQVPRFADLPKSYFKFVWSLARHFGVDYGDIDDVVQDVFVVIYERLSTLRQPESLRSWIYGIVWRTVIEHHRTKRAVLAKIKLTSVDPGMLQPEWVTPQRLAEHSEGARLLWSLLETLDTPKREVFVLAELEEMTAPEIAAAIGLPLNTVYSRLRVARQELEAALQRHNARTLKRGRVRAPCVEAHEEWTQQPRGQSQQPRVA